jgi:hypothetical protein
MAATMTETAAPRKPRIAYHASLRGVVGQAIRDAQGRVWFLTDDDQVSRLTDADAPALMLCGRVDLAATQRLADVLAGDAPQIACQRVEGRQ